MDALCKTDRAWRMERDPDAQAIFEVRLAGLDERPIACRDGVVMHPHVAAAQLDPPDLVVVPGLDDDLEPSFQLNRTWVPWIARWHAAGARVASSCTGAFLAAAAGVLDGKEATTHWIAADAFRRRFPRVLLRPERMIVDAGDVISSGGATTFLTLVIYLTERYGGHDRAVLASKVMLIDAQPVGAVIATVIIPAFAPSEWSPYPLWLWRIWPASCPTRHFLTAAPAA